MLFDSGNSLTGSVTAALSQAVTGFSAIEVYVTDMYMSSTYRVGSIRIPHPQVGVTYRFATGGNSTGSPAGAQVTVDSATQLSCTSTIAQVIGYR